MGLLLRFFCLLLCLMAYSETSLGNKRQKRFSIFSLVQFPNSQCILAMSTTTSTMMGTCFSASECASNGGTASGNCASGFGVCCMFSVSDCGSTISKNCTYIQNPGFPAQLTSTVTCSYFFQANTDICQIRLDFDNLVLVPPSLANAGACAVDTFKVTSSSSLGSLFSPVPPILCGTVTGSHMYFETGRQANAGSFTISTNLLPGVTSARSWKIKATFVECGNPGSAPTDCTQYFTALAGTFQSYNFNNGADTMIEKQLYSVCFRQAEGFCSLGFSQDPSNVANLFLDVKNGSPVSKHSCPNAGLLIPTFSNVVVKVDQQETYCGAYLGQLNGNTVAGEVFATVMPWNIGVFSKSAPLANINIGFKLMFQQMPCN